MHSYHRVQLLHLIPVLRESYFGVWAILMQCELTGKAQEVCCSLCIEDSLVYEKLKSAIFVYELVLQACRQHF